VLWILIPAIVALAAMVAAVAAVPRPLISTAAATAAAGICLPLAGALWDALGGVYATACLLAAGAAAGWGIWQALVYETQHRPRIAPQAAEPRPVLVEERDDLSGHTITVEDGPDGRVVVERHDGLLHKLVRRESELLPGESVFAAARAAAWTYKAEYVSGLYGSASSARHDVAVDNIAGGAR